MYHRVLKVLLILLVLSGSLTIVAQNISVSSFKFLENDLTANTTGTMERDQNGEVAALIKVVTSEQGFVFDGGMTGIVKTKQGVGEIWVYVPHAIKKITIQHPQLGVLRDYWFPISIEKARTYEMVLTTGKVETIVTHSINKQFLVFEVTPSHATVELNDEPLSVDGEGHAEKNLPFGKYTYRISAHNYHTEAGMVEVNNSVSKYVVKVDLRPNFGWLHVSEDNDLGGSDIYVNNEKIGKAPLKSEALKSGRYRVKIVKPLYLPYEGEIEIKDNQIVEVDAKLEPNFAPTTLVAVEGAEIYVDGQRKGVGTWSGPIEKGSYTVEVRKSGHRSTSMIIHITTAEERRFQLPAPLPILSAVEITSNPSNATVLMDGKEMGTTPLLLPDVLVGKHVLTFMKKNYQTVTKEIEVEENETSRQNVALSGECRVTVNSQPTGASVSIDGEFKGRTPITLNLYAGEYSLRISNPKYAPLEKKIVIDGTKDSYDFTLKRSYIYPDALYIEGGVSVLDMKEAHGGMGIFAKNFNAEFSYGYGLQHSEPIYWNGLNIYYKATYRPTMLQGKVGYGIICGNRIRITPQLGCCVTRLVETKTLVGSGAEKTKADHILEDSHMIGVTLSLRSDVALLPNVGISVTPQYIFPVWDSTWAAALRTVSPTIDSWRKGFSLKVGITLYK